tara:strand:- start:8650 stop:10017 length:1368 start_codon:yes stop_codon:yes gene_type:complete
MPIRDILVSLIVAALAIAALKRPYFGALLWVWLGLMNPHRLGWGFAYSMPFAQMAVAVTFLGIALNRNVVRWPSGGAVVVMLCFFAWMLVTSLAAFNVEVSLERYVAFFKVVLMTVVVGSLLRDRDQVVGLIWAIALSIGYFGVKGGIFTIATAGSYRVWGPTDSAISGNNELAVALIMTVPLMYFLAQETAVAARWPVFRRLGEKWIRRGLYAAMFLTAIAAIGSQSRGALLSILAMSGVMWWRSKSKLPLAVAGVVFAGIVLLAAPESWFDRMNTIRTYDQDASALGRLNAWTMAINIANDRISGAGFAMASRLVYELYAPDPSLVLVAHSIYFQVLGEHGYIGLALFLLMWMITYRMAGSIVKISRRDSELSWALNFANMAKVSMVGFAVGGAFLDLAYWDMPYYLMVALTATRLIVDERFAGRYNAQEGATRYDRKMSTMNAVTADRRREA